jgi:hypothetical protein
MHKDAAVPRRRDGLIVARRKPRRNEKGGRRFRQPPCRRTLAAGCRGPVSAAGSAQRRQGQSHITFSVTGGRAASASLRPKASHRTACSPTPAACGKDRSRPFASLRAAVASIRKSSPDLRVRPAEPPRYPSRLPRELRRIACNSSDRAPGPEGLRRLLWTWLDVQFPPCLRSLGRLTTSSASAPPACLRVPARSLLARLLLRFRSEGPSACLPMVSSFPSRTKKHHPSRRCG